MKKKYSQHEGIDHPKIFSPVAMLKSIYTLLAFYIGTLASGYYVVADRRLGKSNYFT